MKGIVIKMSSDRIKPELLAPAGSPECMEAAFRFGADAVYLGGPGLQLRSDKVGFSRPRLEAAVQYAHSLNKKIYVTVNAFASNSEIASAGDYGRYLYDIGADAAIISDLGVLRTVKRAAPGLEAHISTQANCMNWASAEAYYEMGAKRVVLARELSLEEISLIRQKAPKELELEAFVHGAMCMSYSGRCLISSFLNSRSGNRGACTQPCRWSYALMEEKRPGEYFPIEEDEKGSAILSSHDLCCIDLLDELERAGVVSFKIEGRMKTAYYVASVVNAYRLMMDRRADRDYCLRELGSIAHRPYCSGFYLGELKKNCNIDGALRQSCTFTGLVLGYENGRALVEQRNNFKVGDTLEALSPSALSRSFAVEAIFSEEGEALCSAPHPQQRVILPCPIPLRPGDMLRRRDDERILRK